MLIHHVLLYRMEQQYIDAYEGEGWQGANREKVRSRRDIQQAHLQACPPGFPLLGERSHLVLLRPPHSAEAPCNARVHTVPARLLDESCM